MKLAGAVAALLLAAPVGAVVVSGAIDGGTVFTRGGTFIVVADPEGLSVGNNNFDDNNVRAFDEMQRQLLASPLLFDLGGSATAGTPVSSHYVVFDPRRNQTVTGTAVFDRRVLGVIYSLPLLQQSDYLDNPLVSYLNPDARGLETNVDSVSFAGQVVNFSLSGSSPGDTFRVITAANVPEPANWVLLLGGFGIVGVSMRQRRGGLELAARDDQDGGCDFAQRASAFDCALPPRETRVMPSRTGTSLPISRERQPWPIS